MSPVMFISSAFPHRLGWGANRTSASARLQETDPEAKRETAECVEDGDANERELDGRADRGERRGKNSANSAGGEEQSDVFARVEAGSGERKEWDDGAEGGEAGPAARPRGVADGEAREGEEQAVGKHVAVVEQQREVRSAAAFQPPFSHDLRRAGAGRGELEVEDPRPVRDV